MNRREEFNEWVESQRNEKLRPLGKEEVQRRYHERMQKFAVPELIKYFSEGDVKRLIEYFKERPTVQTQIEGMRYDLRNISEEAKYFLSNEIRGKRIIEIGDADKRTNEKILLDLGAESYESTDPRVLGIDGLSYLIKQPDKSAIVCSFGVFDLGVLYDDNGKLGFLGKYRELLGQEIYRVTPKRNITFHGLEFFDELELAGFEKLSFPVVPKDLDTAVRYLSSIGGLKVLRK